MEEGTVKINTVGQLPDLDLSRVKPRSSVEWKTLRRCGKLPDPERSLPGYLLRLTLGEAGMTQAQLA